MAGGIVAACTAVGIENRAAANLSFREGEMGNSEKFFILLSCWLEKSAGSHKLLGEHWQPLGQSCF
jgi:hypothetical protein